MDPIQSLQSFSRYGILESEKQNDDFPSSRTKKKFIGSNLWNDPSLFKCMIDNRTFDILNRYWWLRNAKNTRSFAWSWTNTTSEFGEIVRLHQLIERFLPFIVEYQIVPFRDYVTQWTTCVRERERTEKKKRF